MRFRSSPRRISRWTPASSMTIRATKFVAALALAALPHTGSAADATLRFLEARVQADPLDITAHNRLASLYFRQLRDTGDLTYLDRAANDAGAWFRIRLGELYFRTGQLEKAEQQYLAVPESFLQLDHLAELRAAQGRYKEAVALYEKLVARLPRAEFYQALGDVYQFQSKP